MRRLTRAEKELIILRVNQKHSLYKICKELNLSKTTVYYHFRKLKGRTFVPLIVHSTDDQLEGEVVGIFTGDGSCCKSKWDYDAYIAFGKQNQKYAEYVRDIYERFFSRKFAIVPHMPWTIKIRFTSKSYQYYFHRHLEFTNSGKALNVRLKTMLHSDEFLIGFLRGLLDTDGTVYFNGKTLGIRYYTASAPLVEQLCYILTYFDIEHRIYSYSSHKSKNPQYHVMLRKQEDCRNFLTLVQPYKGRKTGLPGFEPGFYPPQG
jgi:hypothetical protein